MNDYIRWYLYFRYWLNGKRLQRLCRRLESKRER